MRDFVAFSRFTYDFYPVQIYTIFIYFLEVRTLEKVIRTGLCKCFICGSTGAELWRSAANKFSVRCANTSCKKGRTRWLSKEDAIVEWFNLFLYGNARIAFVRKMVNDNQRLRQERIVAREKKAFKGYPAGAKTRQITDKN